MASPNPDSWHGDDDGVDKVKALLLNIVSKCKEEARENKLNIPLEDVEQRVSYYTGVPQSEVLELIDDNNHNDKEVNKNLTLRLKINKFLNTLYVKELIPRYKDIYESEFQKDLSHNITQFKRDMTSMGYNLKKLKDGRMMLVEDHGITFERNLCLMKLNKIWSSDANVYYIDERVISKDWLLQKPSIYTGPPSDSFDEFVLFHVISKTGFLTSLFCHQVTDEDFKKWIINNVLSLLSPSSVIVMDNNPFHGTLKKDVITMYHTKDEMTKWLLAHNIPCANMNKAQLYDLIQKYPRKNEDYDIDRILGALGHEVIRLPSHLQALSATEFMWQHIIKMYLKNLRKGIWRWNIVKAQLMECIMSLPNAQWQEFDIQSQKLAEEILNVDKATENLLDEYKFDNNS